MNNIELCEKLAAEFKCSIRQDMRCISKVLEIILGGQHDDLRFGVVDHYFQIHPHFCQGFRIIEALENVRLLPWKCRTEFSASSIYHLPKTWYVIIR